MISDNQRLKAVPLQRVKIENGFWHERQVTNRNRTIPAIYKQMKQTGRLDAWRLDWKPGQKEPHIFWDSDAGKWIEAVGFSVTTHPNPEFEQQVDEAVELIAQAQQPDGYLNIYYTAVHPEQRWSNLRDRHELYDAGHLIEGAVAYYQGTGKRELLDVLQRYTDYIDSTFGADASKKHGYCGHPEIELALVKLSRATGDQRYFDLAKYFIDERGQQPHYFDIEARERGEDPKDFWAKSYRYCQAHLPVREQKTANGHSVRAAYLFSGAADVAGQTGDTELMDSIRSVWDDVTQHHLYVTGGIGPAHANEGFTFPYDFPNETAYAETCASIALVFWAQRMFLIDPDSRYIDVMERALYNGILSGVSYDGDTFFYANPLASYPNVNPYEHWSGILTERHYRRSEWFWCSCCPPNLARLVASIGSYFYSTTPDTVYVHLYNDNQASVQIGERSVQIEQHTQYPWDGEIKITVGVEQSSRFTLALRVPGWCRDFNVSVNGESVTLTPTRGYVHLEREWANGDEVILSLAMPVERILAHPDVREDAGCIALQRGPVIYCLEEADNGARLANVVIPHDAKMAASSDGNLFGGAGTIQGDAVRIEPQAWPGGLYALEANVQEVETPFTFKAIPYCFWANREPGEMRVWIRER